LFALLTQLLCPKNEALNFIVSISHILTLLSSLAVKIVLPSLKKFTLFTAAVCPLIVFVLMLVPGYHSLTEVSCEALAITFSFGEKSTLLIFLVCPSRVRCRFGFEMFQRER